MQTTLDTQCSRLRKLTTFAELERYMIPERTLAGLETTRTDGRVGGRPTFMSSAASAAAQARRERCDTPTQIAKALGISRATISRHPNA